MIRNVRIGADLKMHATTPTFTTALFQPVREAGFRFGIRQTLAPCTAVASQECPVTSALEYT